MKFYMLKTYSHSYWYMGYVFDNRDLSCRKTLYNNDLNQVVASSGFSENKGLGGVLSLAGS